MILNFYDDKVKIIYKTRLNKEYLYNELLIIEGVDKIKLVEKITGKYIKFLSNNEFKMMKYHNVDVCYDSFVLCK